MDDEIDTVFDHSHMNPVPDVRPSPEAGGSPFMVWGPKTTLAHYDDALEKIYAWRRAKADGASESALAAILSAPAPERPVQSPSAPETPTRRRSPKADEAQPSQPTVAVAVKLPKSKLKLKL